ncbi:restriction endonuclease subunit S [Desulfobacterota bacterium AH_259_B03_O07]|nr:restriction endonuclease subunit S [Desulfobacterota bacterium AH_259_B03_O07]
MLRLEWDERKLNELGFVGRGKSKHRPRNHPSLYGGKYPFIQTSDVKTANMYISNYTQTYNENGLAQSKLWNPGTLCITIAANIAETAILKIKACFPDSIVGFIADPEKADVRFIKYYVDYIKLKMQNVSKGTTQDNLSLDKLLSLDFLVPLLPIQRKIASILSAYDDLIENNTKRIKILEDMAQAIYKEWFVNFRFPGHETAKMVDSELGKIPEGWEISETKNKFETVLGGTPSRKNPDYWTNGKIAWINSGKVNDIRVVDASEFITHEALKKSSAKLMPKRTTVLAITGATLGQVSLLEIEASANQSVVGVFDDNKLYNEYIYLKFCEIINKIIQSAGGGAQQHINKEIVNKTKILIPPLQLIINFNTYVIPLFDLLSNLLFEKKILAQTRDRLLPKLINGEVDVENLDVKEILDERAI